MCLCIKQLWSIVIEDTIVKSIKKCGISNALDGSENHLVYEEENDDDGNEEEEEEEKESSDDEFKGF